MKTIEKKFDAVIYMRSQRERLSEKLSKMTKAEILSYFKNKKTRIKATYVSCRRPLVCIFKLFFDQTLEQ
jgi:aspartate carbamoyltransferase catalytic subunit